MAVPVKKTNRKVRSHSQIKDMPRTKERSMQEHSDHPTMGGGKVGTSGLLGMLGGMLQHGMQKKTGKGKGNSNSKKNQASRKPPNIDSFKDMGAYNV